LSGGGEQQRVAVGADFAVTSLPIVPPAPGRFSTMTVCFQASVIFWPSMRANKSVPPPGDCAAMMRIGFEG